MDGLETQDEVAIPKRFLEQAERPDAPERLAARLPAKLARIADSRLVTLAREAHGYVMHPAISRRTRLLGIGALLYLIAPIDAISDFIPGLGLLDDAAVLTAFVVSVREGAKQVVDHAQLATEQVVSRALSEARESWARRGVAQVCLSLWGATLAACIGLLYTLLRRELGDGAPGALAADPFLGATLAAGGLGLACQLAFAVRVWRRWRQARPELQEPLAWAIVSLANGGQLALLALPVGALAALVVWRLVGA